MAHVTPKLCMVKITLFAVTYSLCVSFTFMKTYRLYCVFSTSVVGTSKYLKNNYQILFSLLLVLPQFVLIAVWYIVFEVRIQVYRHLDAKTNTGQIIYWCGEMDT